jgi:hypothetical protein
MTFQTTKNDPDNRYEEGHFEDKKDLYTTWLGMSPSTGTPFCLISSYLAKN